MLKRLSYGNELINFIACADPVVPARDDTPLTWAMVVIQKGEQFLLHHNYNRKQWECAGGGMEPGETVEQSAIRETLEETSQHAIELQCVGIFKLWLKDKNRSEYGALYTATFDKLQPFKFNNESDRITLWTYDTPLDDNMSELSRWMIDYVLKISGSNTH